MLSLLVDFFAFALELLELDFDERAGGGVAAHDGVARRGPREDEARIVGLAAHGVVSRAEAAAEDHGDFGHDAVGDGVDHFCAGADDAAPLGVVADHEAVDVVQENQRDEVLIAVQDEARGFFGGLGVDDAAELDALLSGRVRACGTCFFWLATMPTAQPPMRA